ncbi:MAG: hypothetical protein OXE73_07440 [Gammaproteobacteria bacterium]|nr:hypothetical protein [Gammaproteobacteria bacterium]
MESDLRKLIDDRLFRNYHREFPKPREFNTFDVLRYADYEIRHSNVLADCSGLPTPTVSVDGSWNGS